MVRAPLASATVTLSASTQRRARVPPDCCALAPVRPRPERATPPAAASAAKAVAALTITRREGRQPLDEVSPVGASGWCDMRSLPREGAPSGDRLPPFHERAGRGAALPPPHP